MTALRQIASGLTIALLSMCAFGQAGSTGTPAFETVSVKLHQTEGPRGAVQVSRVGAGTPRGMFDQLTATNATVKQLIQFAFRLLDSEIFGPGWIETEGYDITARPAVPTTFTQMQAMLRTILAERFNLRSHRETKEIPVYWLTVADGGAKLRDAKEEETFNASVAGRSPFRPGFGGIFTVKDLPGFAERLSRGIGRPVVDKTGIKGRYWFQIEWAADQERPGTVSPALLKALQEQTGLTLEEHTAPMEVLVIDSVERPADK